MSKDSGSEDSSIERKPRGVRLPAVFGCLFIFLMPLVWPISFLWSLIHNWLQNRRERAFREELRARGRLMGWEDSKRKMENCEGTLIGEWYSFKGPVRGWWTPENVREVSPHPVGDRLGSSVERSFVDFAYWCRDRYTDSERGTAFLVDSTSATKEDAREFRSRFMSDKQDPYFVRTTPPEALPKRLRKTQAD